MLKRKKILAPLALQKKVTLIAFYYNTVSLTAMNDRFAILVTIISGGGRKFIHRGQLSY